MRRHRRLQPRPSSRSTTRSSWHPSAACCCDRKDAASRRPGFPSGGEGRRQGSANVAARLSLVQALLKKGSHDDALAHGRKLIESAGDKPEVLNNVAWTLLTEGDSPRRSSSWR